MRIRILLYTLANILAIVLALYILDVINVYKGFSQALGVFRSEPEIERPLEQNDINLLRQAETAKVLESFDIREADLEKKEIEITEKAEAVEKDLQVLSEEQKRLQAQKEQEEREKAAAEAYALKVRNLADRFYNMPPDKSSERLLELKDDLLILDTLEEMDAIAAERGQASIVPYIYSIMPAEDASRLLKKSTVSE